jgi:hypothetical protein
VPRHPSFLKKTIVLLDCKCISSIQQSICVRLSIYLSIHQSIYTPITALLPSFIFLSILSPLFSLSLSLTHALSACTLSQSFSIPWSVSQHARPLSFPSHFSHTHWHARTSAWTPSVPHSVSQSACVIIIWNVFFNDVCFSLFFRLDFWISAVPGINAIKHFILSHWWCCKINQYL